MKSVKLPMQKIKESLDVDFECPSGLRWKNRPRHHFCSDASWRAQNTKFAGKPAGCLDKDSGRYWVLLAPFHLQASRLVWAICNDTDPAEMFIDHRDGNQMNNHISNLRLSTKSENARNKSLDKRNTSGATGVYWEASKRRWRVEINVNKKRVGLGHFVSFSEAVEARRIAEPIYHGEFSFIVSRQ